MQWVILRLIFLIHPMVLVKLQNEKEEAYVIAVANLTG
jgi:hypothetical protein